MITIPVFNSLERFKTTNHSQNVVYNFDNGFSATISIGGTAIGLELMIYKPYDRDEDHVNEQLEVLYRGFLFDDVAPNLCELEAERLLKGIMNLKSYKKEGVN